MEDSDIHAFPKTGTKGLSSLRKATKERRPQCRYGRSSKRKTPSGTVLLPFVCLTSHPAVTDEFFQPQDHFSATDPSSRRSSANKETFVNGHVFFTETCRPHLLHMERSFWKILHKNFILPAPQQCSTSSRGLY